MNVEAKSQKRQQSSLFIRWLWFAFGIAFGLLHIPAVSTQTPPRLRVIVADCLNKSPAGVKDIAPLVTKMIVERVERVGTERVQVIDRQEVLRAAHSDIQHDALPMPFSSAALLRLAPAVQADIIVESQVAVLPFVPGRPVQISLQIAIRDVATQEYIRGGYVMRGHNDLTEAVKR